MEIVKCVVLGACIVAASVYCFGMVCFFIAIVKGEHRP